jgi:hypothetical protein
MKESIPLIFAPPCPTILFTGEKCKTFRVTGGERYNPGDLVSLHLVNSPEFAKAIVTSRTRKRFYNLTAKDWEGHERFASDFEMYKTYSNWEGFPVGAATSLDIIEYRDFQVTNPDLVALYLEQLKQSQPKCTDELERIVSFPHIDLNSPNYNPYKQGGDNPHPCMRC